ncbi:MAG: D-alanyl-D-alanine carboxypeptidase family protein [Xenococcaceae cyanobacterium]
MDDIPEVLRDKPDTGQPLRDRPGLILGGLLGLGVIAVLTGAFFSHLTPQSQVASSPTVTSPEPTPSVEFSPKPTPQEADNLLGHLPYEEAPESDLKAVTIDSRIHLRMAAADKFLEMQAAARANGIILTPISGFRSVSEQDYLFFKIKEQRVQETSKRAEVSAPPGYSEHHTGYAIDIGDGRAPATNVSPSFEKTAAFRWLERNAPRYSFELSFPRNNPQGISYEPWHWRFVGDIHSLETFYKARNLQQPIKKTDDKLSD